MQVQTPPGSNLEYTKMKTEEAARLARSHRDLVRYTFSTIGGGAQTMDAGSATGAVDMRPGLRAPGAEEATVAWTRSDSARCCARSWRGSAARRCRCSPASMGGARKQIQLEIRGNEAAVLPRRRRQRS